MIDQEDVVVTETLEEVADPRMVLAVCLRVVAFQMPVDRINDIMTSRQEWGRVGLGETGETYIVGDDLTLRNQSRFLIEDRENYFQMIKKLGVPFGTVR